jgi:hypothetical protein
MQKSLACSISGEHAYYPIQKVSHKIRDPLIIDEAQTIRLKLPRLQIEVLEQSTSLL